MTAREFPPRVGTASSVDEAEGDVHDKSKVRQWQTADDRNK